MTLMAENEIRHRTVELRASTTDEGVVSGYATTWANDYKVGGSTHEIVSRSAFDTEKAIPLLFEHDWSAGPIGVSRSLKADDTGLLVEFELFTDDPRARNVWRAMKAGAVREYSIGFLPTDIKVSERSAGGTLETIEKGDLIEVSSVLRGANPMTKTVSVRALPPAPVQPLDPTMPPVAPAPVIPGGAIAPVDEPEPTMAGLLGDVAGAVQMAIDLKMDPKQFMKLVQSYFDMLAPQAPAGPKFDPETGAPVAPGAAPAAPAAPVAPAGRSANADLPASLLAKLGGF